MKESEIEKTVIGILDTVVPEEYFAGMDENQKSDFRKKTWEIFIDRIVKKLTPNLAPEKYSDLLKIVESDADAEEVVTFLINNTENPLEEIGQEVVDFKSDIYELTSK